MIVAWGFVNIHRGTESDTLWTYNFSVAFTKVPLVFTSPKGIYSGSAQTSPELVTTTLCNGFYESDAANFDVTIEVMAVGR